MGKTSVINSVAKCISNIALHKLLFRHTNKEESKKHLSDEIIDYTSDVFERAHEYSWTAEEKTLIKEKAVQRAKNLIKRYPDVSYPEYEIAEFVVDCMQEMMI